MLRRQFVTGGIAAAVTASWSTSSVLDWAQRSADIGHDPTGILQRAVWSARNYICFGQSNAAGYRLLTPGLHGPNWPVWSTWAMAHDSTTMVENPRAPLAGPPWAGHSPAEQFARVMRDFDRTNVRTISAAVAGAPISLWDPHAPGADGPWDGDPPTMDSPAGDGWRWMVHRIEAAGNRVDGMLVQHGEANRNDPELWHSAMVEIIETMRARWGQFPVSIGPTTGTQPDLAHFNEWIGSAYWPDRTTITFPAGLSALPPDENDPLSMHFDRRSVDVLGAAHAQAIRTMQTGG